MYRAFWLALLLSALAAAPARAVTFCVNYDACPEDGVEATWEAATASANGVEGSDTIRVGPGWYEGDRAVGNEDRLIGSGRGRTFIAGGEPGGTILGVTGYASDLTVVLDDQHRSGIDAESGTLERLDVDGSALTLPGLGILGRATTYRTGRVVMAHGRGLDSGVHGENLVIEAPVGYVEGDFGGSLRRSVVRAQTGIRTRGAGLMIEDTVIQVHGFAPVGVQVLGSHSFDPDVWARNVTVVGPGSGVGVDVRAGCWEESAEADLDQVAIAGFDTHIRRRFEDEPCEYPLHRDVDVRVRRSAFDATRVVNEGGEGEIEFDAASPVATELKLIDPAGGDLRPRWDSPLIDAGDVAGAADLRGLPRVGPPDVGAYEYQFAPPVPRVATPSHGFGAMITFDARDTVDVDGDPLTFAWSFDDGVTASGAVAEHELGDGTIGADLSVTDVTGRSGMLHVEFVWPPPIPEPTPSPTPAPSPTATPAPSATPAASPAPAPTATPAPVQPRPATERARPLGLAIRARRLRGRAIRYRLSGLVRLPAGVHPQRCAGGHVVIRVPTRRGRDRERVAPVDAACRFVMKITLPRRYRGGWVRLHPLFRGGTQLEPVRGRALTLRP